jgi:hypothetical protein
LVIKNHELHGFRVLLFAISNKKGGIWIILLICILTTAITGFGLFLALNQNILLLIVNYLSP